MGCRRIHKSMHSYSSPLSNPLAPSWSQLYHFEYPPTGDFVGLESSEGARFYFPRQIIMHHSEVIRRCLDVLSQSGCVTIPFESTKKVLGQLLDILDPAIVNPIIDPETIFDALLVADQYQIWAVHSWFQQEVITSRKNHLTGVETICLLYSDPLLVLRCCVRFKFKSVLPVAFHRVIGCHISRLSTVSELLEPWPQRVWDERKRMSAFYSEFADELALWKGPRYISVVITRPCSRHACRSARAAWILALKRASREAPSWTAFQEEYLSAADMCSVCGARFPTAYSNLYNKWEKRAEAKELDLMERVAWDIYRQM